MVTQLRSVLLTALIGVFAVICSLQLQWAFSPKPIISAGYILESWDKAFVRHVHPVWLGENFPNARVSYVSQANTENYFVWDEDVSAWSGLKVDYSQEPFDAIGRIGHSSIDGLNQISNDIVCLPDNQRCELTIIWSDAGKGRSEVEFVGVRVGQLDYLLIERSVLEAISPEVAAELVK